jgi:hypothetical protein
MVPSIPILKTDVILVTFPPQVTLPKDSKTLACSSSFAALIKSVSCSYDSNVQTPNTIRVDLSLTVSAISPQNRFDLKINNLQNPPTLQPTASIVMNVTNSAYVTINSLTNGINIAMNNPSTVNKAAVSSTSLNAGRASDFIVQFYAEHRI